jgi:hypothetical protein
VVPETEPAQQPPGAPSPAELDADLACLALASDGHHFVLARVDAARFADVSCN